MPAGYFTSLTLANDGDYWNLLDWSDGFTFGGGGGFAADPNANSAQSDNAIDVLAFDFGLGAGVLPSLSSGVADGRQWFWSIDPAGPGALDPHSPSHVGDAADIWQSHGILYIYAVPEPGRATLALLGLTLIAMQRRRGARR